MAGNGSPHAGSFWPGETLWLNQAWSIGTEIWFYMLAPLAMAGAAYWRTLVLGLVSLGLMGSIGNRFLYDGYFLWPFWFWVFCAGLLAFLL